MRLITLFLLAGLPLFLAGQTPLDTTFPVRGISLGAPSPDGLERFLTFVEEELAPMGVNTMILRVDYNYAYKSHPELRNEDPLSESDVKRIVALCRAEGIRIIPQINLLGHQSWASNLGNLLTVYPQFDETPDIDLPQDYEWPNEDGLYCKSYCPLHPEVHEVVFALVDELVAAYETNAFHAGMDEVFYLGMDQCPRCSGRDKAELFADEVRRIRNHLAARDTELWIWGDRLIDGKVTGIGMWEASMNNTARAIDMIPDDVVICDWHYEQAVPTAPLFAARGLRVVTCPWRMPEVAEAQVAMTRQFRQASPSVMGERFLGMIHTVWSGTEAFLDQYYGQVSDTDDAGRSQVETLRRMFAAMKADR